MRFSIACALFTAATALSSVPTYTSTIVSSSCSSLISKAHYGNFSTLDSDSYAYETEYVTDKNTLTMLRTVCSNDDCYVTTILNKLATVVTTVDGILTTYVTALPYTVVFNDETTSTISSHTISTGSNVANVAATATEAVLSVSKTGITHENNYSTSSHLAPTATDSDSTIEEFITSPQTTVITVTTCVHHNCYATSVTTGVTVVATTVDGVKTEYTTYCPLATESTISKAPTSSTLANFVTSAEKSKTISASITGSYTSGSTGVHTTIVTVTSCNQNKCATIPVLTGVSYITATVSGTETVFTTFCPFVTDILLTQTSVSASSTKSAPVVIPESTTKTFTAASSRSVSVTSAGTANTVNVITNNIVTISKATSGVSNSTSGVSSVIISSYEGNAAHTIPYLFSLPLVFLLL